MNVTYYHILDLDMVGKEENYVPYLYKPEIGWVVDDSNVLMDRIMGYDVDEADSSPYRIGNSDIMNLVKEISESEAKKIIAK